MAVGADATAPPPATSLFGKRARTLQLVCPMHGETMPSDFALTYTWYGPSVPPPYHYQYVLHVTADGGGSIEYALGYDRTPVWRESLQISRDARERIFDMLAERGALTRSWSAAGRHAVGGPARSLTVVAQDRTVIIPAFPDEPGDIQVVYDAIETLVPQAIWDRFAALRDDHIRRYQPPGA